MPILDTQFDELFARLEGAFSVKKSGAIKDQWLIEFEDCDYRTFCKTIERLTKGERFPTWAMVWDTYRPILPQELQKKDSPGCADCHNGRVFYVDYIYTRKGDAKSGFMDYSLVGNCGACSEDAISRCGNVLRREMSDIGNGEYWTQRALKMREQEQEKVEKQNILRREKWKIEKATRRRGIEK